MSIKNFEIKQLEPYIDAEEHEKSSKQQEFFDPHLSRKKKIIFWVYLITLLSFITCVLSLISTVYEPVKSHILSDSFYYANQVVHEWSKGFITDIVITNSNTCPSNYDYAFNYKWRGTGFGCLCASSSNTSFVLEAYCSPALIQANCTNIPSQNLRQTHFWKNDSNICIKRSSVSFANEQRYDNKNKICGNSQSLVIVPNSEPCPLVNISMNTFNLEDHIVTLSDTENVLPPMYAVYNSTSPFSFYSYPINKFSVSQYEFCLIDQDTGSSPNHFDFILYSVPTGCAQQGNYSQIDQTTQVDFYANNPSLQSLTTSKGYPEPGNWKYKLGFASLPGWTYRCRHNLNGKFSIANTSKQFNFELYNFLSAGSITMIVCCIVISIQIFILGLRRLVNNTIYPVGYKQVYMPEQFWWSMTRYIIDWICKILIIVFSVLFTINGYLDWNWYKQVQNQKCHHDNMELVQTVILPYSQLHFYIFKNSLAIAVIAIVMIIIDIVHFEYIYSNELIYYLVNPNQQLVDRDQPIIGDSLDRLNDLKWLEVENIESLRVDKDDELRITMAQNLFANQQNEPQIVSKLKGKKKKKAGPTKKLFNKEVKQQTGDNPFDLDYQIFGDLDNLDQPSTNVLKPASSMKKKLLIVQKNEISQLIFCFQFVYFKLKFNVKIFFYNFLTLNYFKQMGLNNSSENWISSPTSLIECKSQKQLLDKLVFIELSKFKNSELLLQNIQIMRMKQAPYQSLMKITRTFQQESPILNHYFQTLRLLSTDISHKNLAQTHFVKLINENNMCMRSVKIQQYSTYYGIDLRQVIQNKKRQDYRFTQGEIFYVAKSLISLGCYLKSNNILMKNLVFATECINLKISSQVIKAIQRHILFHLQPDNKHLNYFNLLSIRINNLSTHLPFAPEFIPCLIQNNLVPPYDYYKCDLFSIGMILIQMLMQNSLQRYYRFGKTQIYFDNHKLTKDLNDLKNCKIYNEKLIHFLQDGVLKKLNKYLEQIKGTVQVAYKINLIEQEEQEQQIKLSFKTQQIESTSILKSIQNNLESKLNPLPLKSLSKFRNDETSKASSISKSIYSKRRNTGVTIISGSKSTKKNYFDSKNSFTRGSEANVLGQSSIYMINSHQNSIVDFDKFYNSQKGEYRTYKENQLKLGSTRITQQNCKAFLLLPPKYTDKSQAKLTLNIKRQKPENQIKNQGISTRLKVCKKAIQSPKSRQFAQGNYFETFSKPQVKQFLEISKCQSKDSKKLKINSSKDENQSSFQSMSELIIEIL